MSLQLSEMVPDGAILCGLGATKRDDAIVELLEALERSGNVSPAIKPALLERVLERERLGSTGFGRGVAVPHVKHPEINRLVAAIGVSATGIEFQSLDLQPVYSIVLLVSPEDRPDEHLQAMEVVFRQLRKEIFRSSLRQATDADQVRTLLIEADRRQVAG